MKIYSIHSRWDSKEQSSPPRTVLIFLNLYRGVQDHTYSSDGSTSCMVGLRQTTQPQGNINSPTPRVKDKLRKILLNPVEFHIIRFIILSPHTVYVFVQPMVLFVLCPLLSIYSATHTAAIPIPVPTHIDVTPTFCPVRLNS